MKQNLLTHIMRLTILFLLFFGWGTGTAVAGSGLEGGGTTPTKPTALAAALADPAVGPALLDFLSGNTAGITAAARVNRLKAWEAINDLPYAIRTNTTILSKGDELMTLGFSKTQFRTLATLDDANALDIAKRLRNNHNLDFDKITNIVDNSHILGGEFITSIDNISKGPGKLLNPNGLNSKLDEAVNTSTPNEGIKLTADDAGKRINNGSDIHIENGKADLEDLTLGESVQHKLVNGSGSTATRDNLASATNQLRGSGGEIPSQPTTIAHVRIDNAAQAEANLSRADMLDMLSLWHQGNNVNYTNISKVVIENTTGKHVFDVVSEITN